jgi:uncharacterized membrane protein
MLLIVGFIILAVALILQLVFTMREYYWLRRQSTSEKVPLDVRNKIKDVISSTSNWFIMFVVIVIPTARLSVMFANHSNSPMTEYLAILLPLLGAIIWLYFIYSRLRAAGAAIRQ